MGFFILFNGGYYLEFFVLYGYCWRVNKDKVFY